MIRIYYVSVLWNETIYKKLKTHCFSLVYLVPRWSGDVPFFSLHLPAGFADMLRHNRFQIVPKFPELFMISHLHIPEFFYIFHFLMDRTKWFRSHRLWFRHRYRKVLKFYLAQYLGQKDSGAIFVEFETRYWLFLNFILETRQRSTCFRKKLGLRSKLFPWQPPFRI